MSRQNATFWSKVGETGVGEQGAHEFLVCIFQCNLIGGAESETL